VSQMLLALLEVSRTQQQNNADNGVAAHTDLWHVRHPLTGCC
jgi:hypothetical protein